MMRTSERYPTRLVKKMSSSHVDPEDDDDDEIDETFVALQKLLMSMNGARGNQVTPASVSLAAPNAPTSGNNSNNNNSSRQSQEEILECRRREREQFRHSLFGNDSSSSARRRCRAYYHVDDDEDEEVPVQSVESTISNRFMNGSFSQLNVHVISRDRWSREETERITPVLMLPKDGKVSPPTDNPKLKIYETEEHSELRASLMDSIASMKDQHRANQRFLTPPRSTWCIQMHDFDALESKC